MATPKVKDNTITIAELQKARIQVNLLGAAPLIMNSMPFKAKKILLAPQRTGRMTSAEKAASFKHDVYTEYVDSTYQFDDEEIEAANRRTRLAFPSDAFKQAMAVAALETPGAKRTSIDRLLRVEGEKVEIFGVPQLYMAVVRNQDQNHTPDIRTRAIIPMWCCRLTVTYFTPNLREVVVGTLLSNAGEICGIGDKRQGKGKGDAGRWTLVDEDHPDFQRIVATMGKEPQDKALAEPAAYDRETLQMVSWFDEEMTRRLATRTGTKTLAHNGNRPAAG